MFQNLVSQYMSGWTVFGVKAKRDTDNQRRTEALTNFIQKIHEEENPLSIKRGSGHVYVNLETTRVYDFSYAEDLMQRYSDMIECAFVLGANDTQGTGHVKFYENPEVAVVTDEYQEDEREDGHYQGAKALQVISVRNDIYAVDPFHSLIRDADP